MKVLLIKDVYKLGHAGDVKKVAAGYGRNYLIPQGLAVLATPGALTQADRIRDEASIKRASLNQELSGVANQLSDVQLTFPAKAGEGEKLYGSITHRMVADALIEETGVEVSHKQIHSQPIRTIGIHTVSVRLTIDLVPEIQVVVYREGETAQMVLDAAAAAEAEATAGEAAEVLDETEAEATAGEAAEVLDETKAEATAEVLVETEAADISDEAEVVEETADLPEGEDQKEEPLDQVVEEDEPSNEDYAEEPPAEDLDEVLEADEE